MKCDFSKSEYNQDLVNTTSLEESRYVWKVHIFSWKMVCYGDHKRERFYKYFRDYVFYI